VLSTQSLDPRTPDTAMLTEEVDTWEAERNKNHAKGDWQFTTANACVKLGELATMARQVHTSRPRNTLGEHDDCITSRRG
jgi:hypothetical protein